MSLPVPPRVEIAQDIFLDGRLALFHRRESWLALADLHFGFELSQRAAGRLVPFWGMKSATERLSHLLADYQPKRLIIVGDLVHDQAATEVLRALLSRVAAQCEVIAIAGNHDRKLRRSISLVDSFSTPEFEFHHGNCHRDTGGRISIVGHFHPAAMLRDGAGLHLKFPAFVQEAHSWILPAFSSWAAGTVWEAGEKARVWVCTPHRILSLEPRESAA